MGCDGVHIAHALRYVSVSSGGSSLFWGQHLEYRAEKLEESFSILWWIEFVLGRIPSIAAECPRLFQYPLVDRVYFGVERPFVVHVRRKVSVSSGGSSLFWGWPKSVHYVIDQKFQYPLVDRVYFGEC